MLAAGDPFSRRSGPLRCLSRPDIESIAIAGGDRDAPTGKYVRVAVDDPSRLRPSRCLAISSARRVSRFCRERLRGGLHVNLRAEGEAPRMNRTARLGYL
jgi:hypothetical protein